MFPSLSSPSSLTSETVLVLSVPAVAITLFKILPESAADCSII